jgi:phosphatidylglycerol:prolipoprotein diacylglycerol transferase
VTKRGVSSLKHWEVADFVTTLAIMVVIGSRVGYAAFYRQDLLGFTSEAPYWQMLAFHKGGMSAHGGVLGLLAGTIYLSRKYNHRWMHLADVVAFVGAIGLFFGRLTNFINGELYGRAVKDGEALAWTGMKFPGEMREWTVEQVRVVVPGLQELGLPEKAHPIEWAIGRVQEGNVAVAELVGPHLTVRYPSQLFQAALEGLAVWLLIAILWRKPRKPGLACATWLAGYGVMRFIAEFWRQPDKHIDHLEFATTGLSRGQYLCVAMIAAGAIVAVFAQRQKDAPAMGGWASDAEHLKAWEESDGATDRYRGSGIPNPEDEEADAKPDDAKPDDAQPDDAKPDDAKPDDAKPDDAKPDDA